MVGLQDITILCNSILEWHKECNSQMLAGLRWNGDYIKLHYTFAIPPHFECKNPPHLGGVLCWVISKSRTWRKRTPRGEQPPKLVSFGKLVNFGGCSSWVVLFLCFLIWKPPKKETPPGGGGSYNDQLCKTLHTLCHSVLCLLAATILYLLEGTSLNLKPIWMYDLGLFSSGFRV